MRILRTILVILMTVITVAWLTNAGGFGNVPIWVIVAGYVALVATLPKSTAIDRHTDPSFLVWLVNGIAIVGAPLSGGLFVVSSGLMDKRPFEVNFGVKVSVAIFAISLLCVFLGRYLGKKGL